LWKSTIFKKARMKMMLARLAAVRQATATIRPAFEALDQVQKVRFAGMRWGGCAIPAYGLDRLQSRSRL
jgi:hypothetical protein